MRNSRPKLVAVVRNGKIICITPAPKDHVFGNRSGGYAHVKVTWKNEIPQGFRGPPIEIL